MKLQQLEYIIAIAQAGSITAAAKNLYQAQPNISIALKELESEINMQIFWRTPNGMVLTPEGETFLLRAKSIVESMHSLEAEYTNRSDEFITLKIASARSSYIATSLGLWVNSIPADEKLKITLKECTTNGVIDEVSNGKSDVGIIRIPFSQLETYQEQIQNRKLTCSVLVSFYMKLLLNKEHPLAKLDVIPIEELTKYTEIAHADDEMNLFGRTFVNPEYDADSQSKRINVYETGSKMILLNLIRDAYMWASPTPSVITYQNPAVIEKKCDGAEIKVCDIIICKKTNESNRVIKMFMDHFSEFIKNSLENTTE